MAATKDALQKELKAGMGLSFDIPVLGKASTAVLVLRDAATGVTGSLPIPLRKYQAGAAH